MTILLNHRQPLSTGIFSIVRDFAPAASMLAAEAGILCGIPAARGARGGADNKTARPRRGTGMNQHTDMVVR